MLEIRDLSLKLHHEQILHDINFTVQRAEILVIIGPSGSGKSSLLRCINRLYEPTAGQIMLNNQDTSALPPTELRRKVGMIFQKTAVFDGTVADNLMYGPQLSGTPLTRDEIRELLAAVGLDSSLLNRPATDLSGGQEQRLSIARALANQPDMLLLDEPTSSLDPATTEHVEKYLRQARDHRDLTLIWVSHSIEQARRIADRVLLLEQGTMVKLDTVSAMLDENNGDKRVLAFARGQTPSEGVPTE